MKPIAIAAWSLYPSIAATSQNSAVTTAIQAVAVVGRRTGALI
jgi:hypothetical protein